MVVVPVESRDLNVNGYLHGMQRSFNCYFEYGCYYRYRL